MKHISRSDIHIVSQNSNLSEQDIHKALTTNVFNTKKAWQHFITVFLLTLGIGFTVAGILFFFAYNWDNLHKFVKLGILQMAVITIICIIIFSRLKPSYKNIILTASAFLIGVLYAVFGQIYQLEANAYDFFLVWTLSILIWVLISDFAPLWLLFLILINITFVFYTEQVATQWSVSFICLVLFVFYFFVTVTTSLLLTKKQIPKWFFNLIALIAIAYATVGYCIEIYNIHKLISWYAILPVVYIIAICYGIKFKRIFILSSIAFSILIMVSAKMLKISNSYWMFLAVSLFVIVSVSLIIKGLLTLQKKWYYEK